MSLFEYENAVTDGVPSEVDLAGEILESLSLGAYHTLTKSIQAGPQIRNLTDEEYLEEVITAPEFGGSFIHPGSLRRAGVELAYRF